VQADRSLGQHLGCGSITGIAIPRYLDHDGVTLPGLAVKPDIEESIQLFSRTGSLSGLREKESPGEP
jgi:hypothetical protein